MTLSVPVAIKKMFRSKKITLTILVLVICSILYFQFFHTVRINPAAEAEQMSALELTKKKYNLDPFVSDGCSGNVSNLWKSAVTTLSDQSPTFSEKYSTAQDIPFEAACVTHDKKYHQGEGGYAERLKADNELRTAIINYGINNSTAIKERTGIDSEEQVIFVYEFIAETVYLGVRLGGTPCTDMPYAWGFGYNNGHCE